jgi:hypothetical protein
MDGYANSWRPHSRTSSIMPIFDVEANGKQFEVDAPNMDAAVAGLQQHFNAPSPVENSIAGSAKALGIGGVKGLVGLAGAPADLADAGARGIDYLAGTQLHENYTKPVADVAGYNALKGKIEQYTGPMYEPKTGTEKALQTLGEFGSVGFLGPGSLARKAITQVAAPAAASELAGAATEGTAAEPYARVGGAILGAGGASRIARATDARAVAATAPTVGRADLDAATGAGYRHPEIQALQIDSAGANRMIDSVVRSLTRDRFSEKQAASTYDALRGLRTPEFGVNHTLQDFDATRRILNTIAADGGTEGAAARRAVRSIDAYTLRVPQGDVIAGDAREAGRALHEARANAAAGFRDQRIQDLIERAQNTAGATHSGGNLENELRKGVRSLLNSRDGMRGFSDAERAALQAFARGSASANILRRVSKILGGGGGLGQLASSAMGSAVAGPVGMIAAPALGIAANRLGSAAALNNLQRIAGQVRLRSPAGALLPPPAAMPPQLSVSANALLSGMRAAGLPTAPQFLPAYQ